MFVYTQDKALVRTTGSIRSDKTASYNGKFRVVQTAYGCTTILAEYDTQNEAENAVLLLGSYIEKEKPLCSLTETTMDDDQLRKRLYGPEKGDNYWK